MWRKRALAVITAILCILSALAVNAADVTDMNGILTHEESGQETDQKEYDGENEDPDSEDLDNEDPDSEDPDSEDPDSEDSDSEDSDDEDPDDEGLDSESPDNEKLDGDAKDSGEDPDGDEISPSELTPTPTPAAAPRKRMAVDAGLTENASLVSYGAAPTTRAGTYNVTYNLTGLSVRDNTESMNGTTFSVGLEYMEGYGEPTDIRISVGGKELKRGSDFTVWEFETWIAVNVSGVDGDITINASAVKLNLSDNAELGSFSYAVTNSDGSYSAYIPLTEEQLKTANEASDGLNIQVAHSASGFVYIQYSAEDNNALVKEEDLMSTLISDGKAQTVLTVTAEDKTTKQYVIHFTVDPTHNWEVTNWEWSENFSEAKVKLTCKDNPDHTDELDAAISANLTATCLQDGERIYTAAVTLDGATYTDEKRVNVLASEVAHTLTHYAEKEPTCTGGGNVEYWQCEVCGKSFTDAEASQEAETTAIAAKGHGETEIRNAKEATCTEAGYTGDKVCKICGEVLEKGSETEKLAHTYRDGTCMICGTADHAYKPAVTVTPSVTATPAVTATPTVTAAPSQGGTSANSQEPVKMVKAESTTPKTGDESHIALWLTVMLGAGAALTATVVYSRKRKFHK